MIIIVCFWVALSIILGLLFEKFSTAIPDHKHIEFNGSMTLTVVGDATICAASSKPFTMRTIDDSKVLVGKITDPPLGWSGKYYLSDTLHPATGTWNYQGEATAFVKVDGATSVKESLTDSGLFAIGVLSVGCATFVAFTLYLIGFIKIS